MLLKLLIATSCVVATCQGQMGMPGMPGMSGMSGMTGLRMPATASRRTPGMFNFGLFSMNFNTYGSLQQICNAALLKNRGRAGDYLSDVMSRGVNFMMSQPSSAVNPLAMVKGANSQQWGCLLQGATSGFRNMGNIANGVGDYFDTVVEHPIRIMIESMGIPFNPCDTVFCGEGGMTPLAMMNTLMTKLRMRQSLGTLGSTIFGSKVSMFDKFLRSRGPMGMPVNAVGHMGTAPNAMGQTGTAPNAMGQTGTAPNAMGQTGTSSNSMGQTGTAPNAMGQTGTAPNAMGQTGSSSNSMGQTSAAASGSQGGGLNPLSQMMPAMGQGAAGRNPMSIWKNMAGTGSNTPTTAPGTGSGNMWQQAMSSSPVKPAPSGNPMMDMWSQMATSLTGTGSKTAGTGTGNAWQQMMGGGSPAAAPMSYPGAPGAPGMNMLNNMMNMMFTHQALQDAPDFYPLGSHAMMGRGTAGMGMGSLTGMPNFNMFGQTAAPGPQHTGGSTGTGNTGIPLQGMGMGDIFRMLG